MNCLHPIYIKVDRRSKPVCLDAKRTWTRYKDVRPYLVDTVPVPCGKCINCLKNRQNALVSRALEESNKRGSFIFLTLTYEDRYLPIAQSLWRVRKETGECELVDKGEVISSARDSLFLDRAKVLSSVADSVRSSHKLERPLCYDSYIDGFEDEEYAYFSRLTPSVCRRDVRLWLKRARVTYEREKGCKLSPFSYICVSEYGPNTFRPHYHLAFFGLSRDEASWLASSWSYGFICLKTVNRVNPKDGSDGFALASRYIGKYMAKGKFDCPTVLDKTSEKPRICQSMHIGQSLLEKLRSQMCAFDLYGEYDLDSLFCPSLGRVFNENEVKQLCAEIPKRLQYVVNADFKLPIPRLFREKVFYHERKRFKKLVDENFEKCTDVVTEKVPTALWLLVSATIRDNFSSDVERKFLKDIDGKSQGQIFDACNHVADYEECLTNIEEAIREENYNSFLCKSVF